ncbi:tRNA (adenosine(37)-N6)-threonylcarbamoyltransferase complex ATPase subunit type 1 TsaE [Clostridium folliculivorans]|uniref:tRNA threonylcarbamoyladenosine biosynthesis protein TsaE n=1 Tax=Clostridium folliculivorans TaxID=2886038 RepID=A0A9W5XYH1_9CLOT|nr:tRNA (adenosine(37)-N6)-threonylcarbamoyltransferase complex ATPase subunit type 1 TsaE [Clostridium folliculivorans]GKU23346.1 tRNA (adenosine(37)-N6)-threonylcarbamoyltransferase complex ATPase subunit type 1 TsaE [Clostridium folliculivorans]GKU29463.1 tRNA (adenosine(37)-N6)-threonylcarbamoyltransferase complex ATPase subunit type 1 TsaE [Clostridium folliculivorans]
MEFIINSVDNTIELGRKIGSMCNPGDIFCLTGDLGTGKTHITKGIAEGLNVKEHITSPTFNIVNEYHSGRLSLFHFDVYRVSDPDEIYEIGFDEYIFGNGVSVIEWANYIEELIPDQFVHIKLSKLPEKEENLRKVTIKYFGNRYDYLKELSI